MLAMQSSATGRWNVTVLAVCWFCLCGCKVGPNYREPVTDKVACAWNNAADYRLNGQPQDLATWWQVFQDPVLDRLVENALNNNLQLKESAKRILEVAALRNVAAGNLYPQHQSLDGSYSNIRISENTANFVTVPGFFETDRTFDLYNTNFGLVWELDFWGRLRRTVEAADAQVEQTIAAFDMVKVVLLSEVARTYIEMRTIEARIDLVHRYEDTYRELHVLTEQRLQEGTGNKLDLHQSASVLSKVSADIPGLELLRRQASNRLCVLLGCLPTDIQNDLGNTGMIPSPPPAVAVGIPADLLRRRPDVHAAERQLAEQSAKIGIAQAEFYPHISLTGNIGLQSKNLSQLFQTGSITGNAGPGFSWNILNYGRIKNRVQSEREGFERLCYAYQNSVLKASQEAEDALIAFLNNFDRLHALNESADNAYEASLIGVSAFKEGAIDFGRVLQLQGELIRAEMESTIVRGELALSLVKIYLAVGGGWKESFVRNGSQICNLDSVPHFSQNPIQQAR